MRYHHREITPPTNTNLVAYCPEYTESSYLICLFEDGMFKHRGLSAIDKFVTHYAVLEEME